MRWSGFAALLLLLLLIANTASSARLDADTAAKVSPLASAPKLPTSGPIQCETCKLVLSLARKVLNGSMTEEAALDIAKTYCVIHGGGLGYSCQGSWQCKDVCSGAVDEFGTVVFEVVKQLTGSPAEECQRVGYCKAANSHSFRDQPAKTLLPRNNPAYKPTGANVVRIMQITDIHYDPDYTPGLSNNCGEPVCCRPPDSPATNISETGGYFGDYNCDTPWSVMEVLARTAAELNPDVLFLTGDDPPHNVWRQSQGFNVNATINVSRLFAQHLPNVPVFPGLGNHNGFPVNQYQNDPSQDVDWLYGPLAQVWGEIGWLSGDAMASFSKAGFYTAPLPNVNKGRVIVLNTNLQSPDNFWLWLDDGDVASMLAWFNTTLADAAAAGESVYILMHHPPKDLRDAQSQVFTDIIRAHSSAVRALFFGHHHCDYFQIVFDSDFVDAVPVATAFVPSSINTLDGHNPSFRIYDVDSQSGVVLDFHEYRLDLTKQQLIHNTSNTSTASFELAYSMKDAYQMTDLSPYEFQRIAERMRTDDDLFKQFVIDYNSGNSDGSFTPGDRAYLICQLLSSTPQLYDRCNPPGMFSDITLP